MGKGRIEIIQLIYYKDGGTENHALGKSEFHYSFIVNNSECSQLLPSHFTRLCINNQFVSVKTEVK
jgi:hypothetical protein